MRRTLGYTAGMPALLLAGFAVYLLLVADWPAPRSGMHATMALARGYSVLTADLHVARDEAQRKYGPKAEVGLQSWSGKLDTTVEGKVVETHSVKGRIDNIPGIIAIGPSMPAQTRFPFRLSFEGSFDNHREIGEFVGKRFAETAPAWLLAFDDAQWTVASCRLFDPAAFAGGFARRVLRFGAGAACLIDWNGTAPARLLVGSVIAEGGAWVRHVAGRVCRTVVIPRFLAEPGYETPPDYVGCLLVHAPENVGEGAAGMLTAHLYEMRPDRTLARID